MNLDPQAPSEIFHIYAIYDQTEKAIYIGSTKSKTPKARCADHLRGARRATRKYFGPDGICRNAKSCILEILNEPPLIARAHCLAWGRFFADYGFTCLSAVAPPDSDENLKSEFRSFHFYLKKILCFSPEEVFAREKPYIASDYEPATPPVQTVKQLNIRVKADVIERFHAVCSRFGGTQSEALDTLLRLYEDSSDVQSALDEACHSYQDAKALNTRYETAYQQLYKAYQNKRYEAKQAKKEENQALRQLIQQLTKRLPDPSHPVNRL